jgi:hypothetical protein
VVQNPTNGFDGFGVKNTNTNFPLAFNHVADYMRSLVDTPSTGNLYFLWCPSGSAGAAARYASSAQYLGFDDYVRLDCTGGTGGDCNGQSANHSVQGTHTVSQYGSLKDMITEHHGWPQQPGLPGLHHRGVRDREHEQQLSEPSRVCVHGARG